MRSMGYELDAEVPDDEPDRLLAKLNRRYGQGAQSAGPGCAEYWALRSGPDAPAERSEE
jgi:hypothetical protein